MKALSLMIECRLSKNQYQILSQTSREKHCKLYPHYGDVLKAKKNVTSDDSELTLTESKAFVSFQAFLDHTVNRIMLRQSEDIKSLSSEKARHLILICKWGYGGTSGQSNYEQRFNDADCVTDTSIFFTSFVHLETLSIDKKKTNCKIIV